MATTDLKVETRALRFHTYGEPADVLRLEETSLTFPAPQRVRVKVEACALNPADWYLCKGLFPGSLPRGVGLEVAGTVDALGEGVEGLSAGDAVFGPVDFIGTASAGAADYAILQHWTPVPHGLDPIRAASLPMAAAIAHQCLDQLNVQPGELILINGAGTTVGFAAVQIGIRRGLQVLATAGETFREELENFGATVIPYGDALEKRAHHAIEKAPDYVLDTAPVVGVLATLINIAGDPKKVMTISDHEGAKALGARSNLTERATQIPYEKLRYYADEVVKGTFTIPIAGTYALSNWQTAMQLSLAQKAHGKLVLIP